MGKIDMAFDTRRIEFVSRACDILRDMEHRKVQDILWTMEKIKALKGENAPELKAMEKELDTHVGFWDIGMEMCIVLDTERRNRMEKKEASP